jgi:hypothetical protein
MVKPDRMTSATSRLVTGPASTISARCHSALAWNVRLRSAAGRASHSAVGLLVGLMSPANWT